MTIRGWDDEGHGVITNAVEKAHPVGSTLILGLRSILEESDEYGEEVASAMLAAFADEAFAEVERTIVTTNRVAAKTRKWTRVYPNTPFIDSDEPLARIVAAERERRSRTPPA